MTMSIQCGGQRSCQICHRDSYTKRRSEDKQAAASTKHEQKSLHCELTRLIVCAADVQCLFFKHCDPNRITTETLARCQDIIGFSEFRKPRYAVGCQLYRMAASVCPVRVLVCVIVKDE